MKIVKVIEANDDGCYSGKDGVRELMNTCFEEIQRLNKAKESEVEEYLESFTEEKV